MKVVIVTGTDTGVGKTVVTAALAHAYVEAGRRVAVVKPTQTGVQPGAPGDVQTVTRLTGLRDVHEHVRLRDPLAPDTAARRQGVTLPTVADHAALVRGLGDVDVVLVEGAGGVLVRLDATGATLADLALLLQNDAPDTATLVVTRPGLGTLNHTALTVHALRCFGVGVSGLVFGSWPDQPDLAMQCNLHDLPSATGVPVLGSLPEGAGALSTGSFTRAAAGWFVSLP